MSADIFISYARDDERLARFVFDHLKQEGVNAFLAPLSIAPGQVWSTEIQNALSTATHVVLLASRAACRSVYVQQELGFALGARKQLIPVIWDMPPHDLPGWAASLQALDLRTLTIDQAREQISQIALKVKQGRLLGLALTLIAAAVVLR